LATEVRRILICEDSKVYAKALERFLQHDSALEVAGVYETGEELIDHLEALDPDLITMDLEMPGMGGVRAIERIMEERPLPILVISAHAGKGSERAAEALAAGALEALSKTTLRLDNADDVWATALRSRIKRLASVRLKRRRTDGPAPTRPPPRRELERPFRVVGIGASTGGPPALIEVLRDLPADYPLPVLVVQHIAPGFGGGLVRWLEQHVPPPVRIAAEGERARPGIWFAPDDRHLTMDASMRFSLQAEGEGSLRPSVDVLFKSLAKAAGGEAAGVVLTGMGHDGGAGVEAMRAAGGLVIAQDEATSAVFGMPRVAVEAGADLVMPVGEVGGALRALGVAEAAR
jgi:two-component system chemotaxis response regulator CheB